MAITKMHTRVKVGGKTSTLNNLEGEGILELFERKAIDIRSGRIITKYFAMIPNTNDMWEITPTAYKARVE
jgi:hypothetical protein